ncbi:MAG: tRNA (adenosine(37)-N6)-threonylcarbamoyltransferase complex ATPase subunit type 1 TsaE [Gammaproteobacteria bacterium]|nr:tRNA (adenosine(37)-N6)-threonylcarbamoyltransferase complex ATPase subunit type 1 TsaE [Gammaproteobacteria bacterium]
MIVKIKNLKEMEKFATLFASELKGNEIIALKGNLGAGKTTFTRFVGKALDVKENIISPTFNIVKVYSSKLGPLYHIDAYRLEDLGYDPVLDDYLYDENSLRFVEWYNFLDDPIFDKAIKIEITIDEAKGERVLNIGGPINV